MITLLYSVEEIAKLTELSAATIYRKLSMQEMKDYIIKKSGKRYLDELGLQALQKIITMNGNENDKSDNDDKNKNADKSENIKYSKVPEVAIDINDLLSAKNEIIDSLKNQLEQSQDQLTLLKNQLEIKDQQIATRDKHVENMQVLLKTEQEKSNSILSLPETIKEHDIELINTLQNVLEQRRDETPKHVEEKKGFFSKLFKK